MTLKLLDLFCGSGGSSMGYSKAGFQIVGVDINPQPHYPFEFIQADAMTYPLDGFDVIHASPPCQSYSVTKSFPGVGSHPDLLAATRARLELSGLPWIIENVPGAPMRADITLCGSMFGLPIRRHRLFESNIPLEQTLKCDHSTEVKYYISGHPGGIRKRRGKIKPVGSADEWRAAMQMPWANALGVAQAIPPAYTEFIGRQLFSAIQKKN